MAARPICLPFSVNFDEIHKYEVPGFKNFEMLQILDFCLASSEPIYPEIVTSFWSSCTLSPSGEISGRLLGHDILLSRELLEQLFCCDDSGEVYYDEKWQEKRPKDRILELVYNDESLSDLDRTEQKNLSLPCKVLHLLVTRIICPRTEDVETVTDMDLFVIYSILNEDQINIIDIAYNHLISAVMNPTQSIPFGHLLTKILKQHPAISEDTWHWQEKIPSELLGVAFFRGKGLRIDEPWYLANTSEDEA